MARKTTPKASPETKLVDAALALAAEQPWNRVGMEAIAAAAGVSLREACGAFPEKACIVAAVIARNDAAMLDGDDPSLAEESRRDRLFDAIMRRLEAMRPHKAALKSMACGSAQDPLSLLITVPRVMTASRWMLRAAGIPADGLVGLARAHAVTLIYAAAVRVWLKDDSPDLADTMAALDKALKRAGALMA